MKFPKKLIKFQDLTEDKNLKEQSTIWNMLRKLILHNNNAKKILKIMYIYLFLK